MAYVIIKIYFPLICGLRCIKIKWKWENQNVIAALEGVASTHYIITIFKMSNLNIMSLNDLFQISVDKLKEKNGNRFWVTLKSILFSSTTEWIKFWYLGRNSRIVFGLRNYLLALSQLTLIIDRGFSNSACASRVDCNIR